MSRHGAIDSLMTLAIDALTDELVKWRSATKDLQARVAVLEADLGYRLEIEAYDEEAQGWSPSRPRPVRPRRMVEEAPG